MPVAETGTIFDLPFDETVEAVADAEIEVGKGVPHERVREWVLK